MHPLHGSSDDLVAEIDSKSASSSNFKVPEKYGEIKRRNVLKSPTWVLVPRLRLNQKMLTAKEL